MAIKEAINLRAGVVPFLQRKTMHTTYLRVVVLLIGSTLGLLVGEVEIAEDSWETWVLGSC